jgi:predicted Rossmann fold flavoprotein
MDDTLVIVGGGPAGLFCAAQTAGKERRVVVLEKKPSCGRKLLITGSGQCNITHDDDISEFFRHYGDHGAFLRPALRNFTNKDLIAFFEDRRLAMETEQGGKVFPKTRSSLDVLAVLLRECTAKGVEIHTREAVRQVTLSDGRFIVTTTTAAYHADALVLATGGASYPATGSSGDGYRLAAALGHTITEIGPALTPVDIRDYPFSSLAGISFENATVTLLRAGTKIRENTGDLLLTHTGLSGPGILDFSRYIAPGDLLKVSFLGHISKETLKNDLTCRIAAGGNRQVKTVLSGYPFPERFVRRLLELSGIPSDLTCAHLPKKARSSLIMHILEFPFIVNNLWGFDTAMVTRGGVSLPEINPKTMESRRVPHLYCIGEVLDIDGDTGGYNLQAAFSTAAAAAIHIASGDWK